MTFKHLVLAAATALMLSTIAATAKVADDAIRASYHEKTAIAQGPLSYSVLSARLARVERIRVERIEPFAIVK